MNLIALKLGYPLIILFVSLLVSLILLNELLLNIVLEDIVDGIDSAIDCFLNEICRVILIFDIFKNFEALTSPLLITSKRLLKERVIVKECLLKILYR